MKQHLCIMIHMYTPAMDHKRSWAVMEHLPDMLNEFDQGVRVLGHSMVRPGSEEKVLQFERLAGWVNHLMGTGWSISKFISLSELIVPPCMYIHSHFWLSYPWFRSQHTPSFQSLSQWSPCLVFQKAHSFHRTSTVHTWTVHKEISLTWSTWPKFVSSNKFVNDAVSFIHFSTNVTPAYNYNNGHCVVRENRVPTLPFSNKRVNMTTTGGFWSQIIWMKSERVRTLGPKPYNNRMHKSVQTMIL